MFGGVGRGENHPLEREFAASSLSSSSSSMSLSSSVTSTNKPQPFQLSHQNYAPGQKQPKQKLTKSTNNNGDKRLGRKSTARNTTKTTSSNAVSANTASTPNKVETFTVLARVRPRLSREVPSETVSVDAASNVITVTGDYSASFTLNSTRSTRHKFDQVFDKHADQKEVYKSVEPLINASFEGYNTTIFAYGQTGTGKTHTMLGVDIWNLGQQRDTTVKEAIAAVAQNHNLWGIIPRAMQHIFARVHEDRHDFQYKIWCSYLEIYKEHVYDLLHDEAKPMQHGASLAIREDKRSGVFVPDATDVRVQNEEQVLSMLWKGARNRAMSVTDMNAHSSRSHTIFQVVVERKERGTSIANGATFLRCVCVCVCVWLVLC